VQTTVHQTLCTFVSLKGFLACDAFVRTSRRAIVMVFVRLSVCSSVWDGHALWSYSAC